jgi:Tol biopolymer transport system component
MSVAPVRRGGPLLAVLPILVGLVLVPAGTANAADGTTVRLVQAGNDYRGPVVSSDGTVVVYPLAPDSPQPSGLPPAQGEQLYLFDRAAATPERVTVTTGGEPADGLDFSALTYDVDGDGRRVAFGWNGGDLDPESAGCEPEFCTDVYVRDRAAAGGSGMTYRVSVGWDGSAADGESASPQISDDGTRVVFLSQATNLVEGDSTDVAGTVDVFVRDLPAGPTRRLSSQDLRSQGPGSASRPPTRQGWWSTSWSPRRERCSSQAITRSGPC